MPQRTTTRITDTFIAGLDGHEVTIDEITDVTEVDMLDGSTKEAQGKKKYRLRETGAHVNRDDAGFYLPTGERLILR